MTGPLERNDDFADMLRCRVDVEAEFVIAGAHAFAAHGLPRATFEAAWSSRIELMVQGLELSFLGRDALIANQLASGREKDLLT